MKTTSIYATEKKSFIFAADAEQRGLNATLKAINAVKGMNEAGRTLAADGLNWSVFKTAKDFTAFISAHLPQVFNKAGALCAVRVVEDTAENRETFAGLQVEDIRVNDAACIRVWVPMVKYTCTQVYNLAKRAAKGAKAAEKAADKAAKAVISEARKAERKAARIAQLKAKLAELEK